MDNYIVSARKYRPSTFRSVVGQKSLTQTLKNAIDSQKLAHAYLFCGPRGVGKTTCARIFAKTINCLHPTQDGEACNTCESCQAFNEQRSYNISELDAASNNSIEDIRQLIEQVRIPPQLGRYKVFIIDEVHMLSTAAFNAFLKTLEEPPKHALFILATTEKHKILPTILSRCQIYDFHRINLADTIDHLKYVAEQEHVTAETEALSIIAQKADGGMRDALSIFDQVVSFTSGNITYQAVIDNLNVLDYEYYFRLVDAFLKNAVPEALLLFNDILNHGFEAQHFITGLSSHLRDLLVSKDPSTLSLLEVAPSVAKRFGTQAASCNLPFLYKALELSNECDLNYRISNNKKLLVELTLIKLCQITAPVTTQSVAEETIKPIGAAATVSATPQVSAAATPVQQQAAQQPAATTVQPQTVRPGTPGSGQLQSVLPRNDSQKATPRPNAIPSFSIKKTVARNETEEIQQQEVQAPLNTPFTITQLETAWDKFIDTVSTETVLVNTMRTCKPTIQNATTFEVVVDNPNQLERLHEKGADLMQFLKKELQNTQVVMSMRISEKQEKQKVFSQREKFEFMAQQNPHLIPFKDRFGLELS